MLSILALGAAVVTTLSLPAAPVPIKPDEWATNVDYPSQALRTGEKGRVFFALTVSTEGMVVRCTIERSSGSKLLDDTSCTLLRKRARFNPARGVDGQSTWGIFRSYLTWNTSEPRLTAEKDLKVGRLASMAVGLAQMPPGLVDPAFVGVGVSVTDEGAVTACSPAPLSPALRMSKVNADALKILGPTACSEALRGLKLAPALNEEGKAVASVQTTTVVFGVVPASPQH